jgi:hypothetical protein
MSKMQVGRKQYHSMRGLPVDMELLRKKNELTPAVGNARVNARGDELGPGGKIIKKREEIIKEFYNQHPKTAKEGSGVFKESKIAKEDLAPNEAEMLEDDEWIEDENGNFVRKGQ